jgi:hypothetical protein
MANLLPMCANAQLIFRSKLRYRGTWRYFLMMEIATASEQLRRHRLSMCTKAPDNRPAWYRLIWRGTALARFVVSRLPHPLRLAISQTVAALIYWPLARCAVCATGRALGAAVSAVLLCR